VSRRRVLAAALALLPACEVQNFTIGLEHEPCEANLPTACGAVAHCVLEPDHYLDGVFPSARRFIIRTDGEESFELQFLIYDQRTPGTELLVIVHEPSCGERYTWDSGGRDLFRMTGSDGVLRIPFHVINRGDHLVEITSDANASYALKQVK
jgi:hypothetical protein